MKHPEALLVPVLMLSDYALTVAGARMRSSAYGEHFKVASYELNPLWQNAVAKLRWFNPRFLALVAVVTALVWWVSEIALATNAMLGFLFGFIFALQGMINGRHLGNLAIFAYLRRHPDQLSGQVSMGHEFVLWTSLFQTFAVLLPLLLSLILAVTPQAIGAVAGIIGVMLANLIWISRHRARQTKAR